MRAPLLLPLLLAACPSPDVPQIRAQVPEIVVAPEALVFGDRAVPLEATESFFLSNGGRADLEVTMAVEGDEDDVFALPVSGATLEPGQSLEVAVAFTPATFLDYDAEIVLSSNDEDTPELRLPVTGTGVSAPLPDILLSHTTLDFGEVDGEVTEVITVTNVGLADLEIDDIVQVGSPSFQLLADPAGNTVAPGNDATIVVRYAPPNTNGDDGTLTIRSNDPDEGEVDVLLLGNGGADYEYPVAVIDCPGAVDPPAFVTLTAYDSTDPEGHTPLSYEWTLVSVPTDGSGTAVSSAYLTNAVTDRTSLWVDAVGTYVVELTVENAIGVRSAPARCTVEGIPDEELVVELTWSTSRADLDLHVAETDPSDPTPIFQRPEDACYCNRTASWGAAGQADDGRLDLDDRAGYGPENISADLLADGRYDVRVHYFDDQGDSAVTATVRVYLEGTLAFTASRVIDRNEVWDAARVNWPEGTVAALSTDLYDAPRRSCFNP